jgi:hypothetical protein
MHADQAARRLLESVGVARIGSRINQRFEEAFRSGSRQKWFHYKQPFLYANSECLARIRDRSNLPAALKNIEHVPPAEIAAAVIEVVAGAFTIQRAEAVSSSLALLGFQRATKKAYGQVDVVVEQLIAGGQLNESGAVLSVLGD